MKLTVLLMFFISIVQICTSQNIENLYIPKITQETEYFSPNNFSFEPKNIELEIISDIGTKYIAKRVNTYYETDFRGNTIVNYYKNNNGEIEGYVFPNNSIIGIMKIFYKSGNLKTKGLLYYSGFNIGKWYEFSENGEFTGSIDKDKEYLFGWKDVFAFCKKNDISLERIGNGKATSIFKYKSPDGKFYWRITYRNKDTKEDKTEIILDSKNGEILSKVEMPWLPCGQPEDE